MIVKIEARNRAGNLLSLEMENEDSGYSIQNPEGLGPVRATLVSTTIAGLDGQQYHSSRREPRYLIFKIGLEPVYGLYTVEDLRKRLYSYFMPKSAVNLRFIMEDGLEVDILGITESFEPDNESQDPVMKIAITCHQPDFIDMTLVTVSGSTTSDTSEVEIDYAGNIDTGFKFTLNVNRTVGEVTLYQRLPNGDLFSLDVAIAMVAGDILQVSTLKGSKYATLTHLGSTTSIVYAVVTQSSWFELTEDSNFVRAYAIGAAIPYTIEYYTRYGAL